MWDTSGIGGTGNLIGAGISTAGNIAAGLLANSAASDTSSAALKAASQANALQEKMFNQGRQDLMPWTTTGGASLGRLSYLLGLNPGSTSQGAFNSNYGPQGATPAKLPGVVGGTNSTIGSLVRYGGGNIGGNGNAQALHPGTDFNTVGQVGGIGRGVPEQNNAMVGNGLTADDHITHWNPETQINTHIPGRQTIEDRLGVMQGSPQGAQPAQSGAAPASGTNDGQFGSLMRDFSLSDFQTDPGYQFRLGEGQQALERSAAARGGLFSGGMLKDLTKYNQDFASNEYGNAFNRWNINQSNKYNRLSNLAGMGQVSTGQLVNSGQNYANQAGTNLIASQGIAAGARASGYGALANGLQSGANTIATLYGLGRA